MATNLPPGSGEPQLAEPCSPKSRGWYQPRDLPHLDRDHSTQMITYRLADSLPREVARRRAEECDPARPHQYRRRIETSLDAGYGSCCLGDPAVAQQIVATWQHFAPERYLLRVWVVMPNHVHVLITQRPGWSLGRIVQSWKSWTARVIVQRLGELGLAAPRGWQRDYWDRLIRDADHYCRVRDYIHRNPVMAGLCRSPEEWPWSSAKADARE